MEENLSSSNNVLDEGTLISPKTLKGEAVPRKLSIKPKKSKPVADQAAPVDSQSAAVPTMLKQPASKSSKTLYLILLLVVFMLVAGGLVYWNIRDQQKTDDAPAKQMQEIKSDKQSPRILTYTNEEYGFTFSFPSVFAVPPSDTFDSGSVLFRQNFHFSAFGRDAFGGLVSVLVVTQDNADAYVATYTEPTEIKEVENSLGLVSKSFSGVKEPVDGDGLLIEEVYIFPVDDNFVELKYLVDKNADQETYNMQHDIYMQIVSSFDILRTLEPPTTPTE